MLSAIPKGARVIALSDSQGAVHSPEGLDLDEVSAFKKETGTLAGLLGIGGGIIIVPIVTLLFETQGLAHGLAIKMALGTSLATIIVTAISSIYTHHRKGAVDWHLFKVMAPGALAGSLIGAGLADVIPGEVLYAAFILFMYLVSAQMAMSRVSAHRTLPEALGARLLLVGEGPLRPALERLAAAEAVCGGGDVEDAVTGFAPAAELAELSTLEIIDIAAAKTAGQPLKGKKLTNIRAAGRDENVILTPPRELTIETALDWIDQDELVEVTPDAVRVRKKILECNRRPKREAPK